MSFGKNLKLLRKNSGFTQKELSTNLGVALSTIAMWETDNRQPDLDTVKKISDFFKISVDDLITDESATFNNGSYLSESDMSARITPNNRKMNNELAELREMLRTRPEVKMLFSVSKNASKKDIVRAVAIIEALKSSKERPIKK